MLAWMSKECEALVLDNSRELGEMKIAIWSSMVLLCEQPVERFASMSLGGEQRWKDRNTFPMDVQSRCFRCIVETH
jgi:hypothetical protein